MTDQTGNGHAEGDGYMLYHSIGQYPGKARDMAVSLTAFAECWGAANDEQWGYALGQRQRFIDLWSQLLNAPSASLTTTENVTSALAALIMALPREDLEGRVVLVAGDCFPSLHFLLTGLAERYGFELRTVQLRDGAHWVEDEDVIAAWGPEVGLALLTWVSSTSSHRCDLEALVAHGRSQGSLIGVDITQAAGLIDYDCMAVAADFAISTSLKWMCGSPGGGILQVMPDVIAPLLRDLDEAARPVARDHGDRAQPRDDTFGWGVVLSDETLDNLAANDPVSAEAIRATFAYWDDIAVVHKGERIVSTGHGFCGIGRKQAAELLQARARELGVDLRFETEFEQRDAYMRTTTWWWPATG
jgi:selenocysteine lyase/cysteine desulfurase